MSEDNYFKDDPQKDPQKGKKAKNLNTRKRVNINGQDFNVFQSSSQPQGNDVYEELETSHILTDHAGNRLPDDANFVALSHTGLFITSAEQIAHCNYWLHSQNRSRIILIGQDGQHTVKGAICSHCSYWPMTINIVLSVLALGVLGGILKAGGIF